MTILSKMSLSQLRNWHKFVKLKNTIHRRHFMQHLMEMTVVTTKNRTQTGY